MKKRLLFLVISFVELVTAFFMQGCASDDYYERNRFRDDGGYYDDRAYYHGDRYEGREHREYRTGDDEGEIHWWRRDRDDD